MTKHGMDWYVNNNDFEGALERFENTTPSWRARWFNICATIFNANKELAKKYILDPIAKTIHAITKVAQKIEVFITNEVSKLLDECKQKCYLFEFFDKDDNFICSKIGTTTRKINERMQEELKSKTYVNMGAVRAIVRRIYDCGSIPAEGLESFFRACYIKKYPQSFVKNDRFMKVQFDLQEADRIYKNYMET